MKASLLNKSLISVTLTFILANSLFASTKKSDVQYQEIFNTQTLEWEQHPLPQKPTPYDEQEGTSNIKDPHFVIFLIHGLTGDTSTFGNLKTILEESYQEARVAVVPLTYYADPKKDQGLDLINFADRINKKARQYYRSQGFGANGKPIPPYGVITHSQGGLVTNTLALGCFPEVKNLKFIAHFGSPQGGSGRASIIQTLLGEALLKKLKLSSSEMKGLEYGSRPVQQQIEMIRKLIADKNLMAKGSSLTSEEKDNLDRIAQCLPPDELNIYNIIGDVRDGVQGGVAPVRSLVNLFTNYLYGKREFDLAVDVFSARSGYIEVLEDSQNQSWNPPQLVNLADKTVVIKAPHFDTQIHPSLPSFGSAMAQITLENYSTHAGYYILKQFLNKELNPLLPSKIRDEKNAQINSRDPHPSQLNVEEFRKQAPKTFQNFQTQVHFILPAHYSPYLTHVEHTEKEASLLKRAFYPLQHFIHWLMKVDINPESFVKISPQNPQDFEVVKAMDLLFTANHGINQDTTTYFHQGRVSAKKRYSQVSLLKQLQREDEPKTMWDIQANTALLNYQFQLPGWKVKSISIPIAPTFITHVYTYLEPYTPSFNNHHSCYVGIVRGEPSQSKQVVSRYPSPYSQDQYTISDWQRVKVVGQSNDYYKVELVAADRVKANALSTVGQLNKVTGFIQKVKVDVLDPQVYNATCEDVDTTHVEEQLQLLDDLRGQG